MEEDPNQCPRSIEMLLTARCSPNEMGSPMQSPLLFAIGSRDRESVEDLLMARADVNYTPFGREPPVYISFHHRMHMIARTLLTYQPNINSRGFSVHPPGCDASGYEGPTLTELAVGDQTLTHLLAVFRQDSACTWEGTSVDQDPLS